MRSSEGRASATLRHQRTRHSSRGPRIRRVARARRLELRAPDGRWLIETCSRSRRTSADPRPPNLSIPAATVRLAQLNPRRIAIPTRPPVSAFLAVPPAPRARSPARTWSTTAYSFVAWPIHATASAYPTIDRLDRLDRLDRRARRYLPHQGRQRDHRRGSRDARLSRSVRFRKRRTSGSRK